MVTNSLFSFKALHLEIKTMFITNNDTVSFFIMIKTCTIKFITLTIFMCSFFFFFFLAAFGLRCCVFAFSSCREWGLLSSCGAWAFYCGGVSCCIAWALE